MNKMSTGLDTEGMDTENQNSFAVLSNIHIVSLASKMGVNS